MSELNDLLDRASDRIAQPHLAASALVLAKRRRARNRGVAGAAVAAALVVTVVVSVELATGGARVDTPPVQSQPPTPIEEVAVVPPIPAAAIQPVWDPRGAEGLPVTDLGVPRVMESLAPGEVTRPVAVLDDGKQARLVSADGLTQDLAVPDGLGELRTISLSPDGTRLAAAGASGLFSRTLAGDWERLGPAGEGVGITWTPDGTPVRRETPVGLAPDGTVVDVSLLDVGPLENLQRPVVSDSSIAAARANASWPDQRQRDDYDGLVAVDRDTWATRAFLRVPDLEGYYVDGGTLTPIAWLDDDTVAFTVLPKGAPKSYLVTWDVETGDLSRISCWERSFDAVFATDLLRS